MRPATDTPIACRRPATPELLRGLGQRFGERLSTAQPVRDRHGRDESPYDTTPPDCVVFPTTTTEVAEGVRLCARHRTPLIAYKNLDDFAKTKSKRWFGKSTLKDATQAVSDAKAHAANIKSVVEHSVDIM